ncbi:NADPH-dependent FMN reductase [Kitasatospora sp. NPDC051853]|uniref:NADPH-dependent FMN reductase n=1 Tax=Kitasatospora sp. NPDC051853 TaxID=3364058 RepID=UPI0037AA5A49
MTRVLAVCGSLREGSVNRRLLRAAARLAPEGMEFRWYRGLADLPHYDEDLDARPPGPPVRGLREQIRRADALVIAMPEYNHSVPGVLKNAIDWASRPKTGAALSGKPVALMVATPSRLHGHHALAEAARVLDSMGNTVVARPGLLVRSAPDLLPEGAGDGLTDRVTAELLRDLLEQLGRAAGQR